jgi:tetratricopeptide (TPR) repeat protein
MFAMSLVGCFTRYAKDDIPIYRASQQGQRIYVEAELNGKGPYLFMIDTGASISVLQDDVAEELGLFPVRQPGFLQGLSGRTQWSLVNAELEMNQKNLGAIDFAVDVDGIPNVAGSVPLAGLLGNNLFQNYIVEIDYSRHTLSLHTRESFKLPDSAVPMSFDGRHASISTTLHYTANESPQNQDLELVIDTGSRGLLFNASEVPLLTEFSDSEGKEPVLGIGASGSQPLMNYMRSSHRAQIKSIDVGGITVDGPHEVTILHPQGNQSMFYSLLGHDVLDKHVLYMDYLGGKMALQSSPLGSSVPDINKVRLERMEWSTREKADLKTLAALQIWNDKTKSAIATIERLLEEDPENRDAQFWLVDLYRQQGEFTKALGLLQSIPADYLIEELLWTDVVNSIWLSGDIDVALSLAQGATVSHPSSAATWLAYSDVQRELGEYAAAKISLHKAVNLNGNPDSFLLRRAWLSHQSDDTMAALTHLQRQLHLNSIGGPELWFYVLLFSDSEHKSLLLSDLMSIIDDLHDGEGGLDFQTFALQQLGQTTEASKRYKQGVERDCSAQDDSIMKTNCECWYNAMLASDLYVSEKRMKELVAKRPYRADFRDTLAVIQYQLGKESQAYSNAMVAAQLSPSDIYMLWQKELMSVK